MKQLLKDKKDLVILLLAILFFLRVPVAGGRFFLWVVAGVLIAPLLDFFLSRIFYKKNILPKSAIISGFIVSGIIDYHQKFWQLFIFSVLAIISKYFLRFKKKHIFNPANFGLFLATLFKVPLTWNIESNILLIIIVGAYLSYSYKKMPHILGFLVFFMGLFAAQHLNPLRLISWFFLFIMLIEPKTSGYGNIRGFVFGGLAAIFSFLIFMFFPSYDIFVCSLFFANLAHPILERIKT